MLLTDMKRTYGVSRTMFRVTFALLCGMLFHTAYFILNFHYATIQVYAVLLVALYKALDWYEDYAFTRPINVSLRSFKP